MLMPCHATLTPARPLLKQVGKRGPGGMLDFRGLAKEHPVLSIDAKVCVRRAVDLLLGRSELCMLWLHYAYSMLIRSLALCFHRRQGVRIYNLS